MGRGLFIVIEGANRLYKTTFKHMLKEVIQKKSSYTVITLGRSKLETTDCPTLANYLSGQLQLSDQVVHHLFSADRWRLSQIIQYLLSRGVIVILNRYVVSGHVYTIAQGNLDQEWCSQFDKGLIKPDITIYLERDKLPVGEPEFEDPDIYENSQMQIKIKECFQNFKNNNPDWFSINISRITPRQVLEQLVPVIINKMNCLQNNDNDPQYY